MPKLMKGLTVSSLKRHPSLVPLLAAIGLGGIGASAYLLRLATQNPDVSWDRSKNPYPWQKLKHDQQYKFVAVNMDYKNLKPPADRPDI